MDIQKITKTFENMSKTFEEGLKEMGKTLRGSEVKTCENNPSCTCGLMHEPVVRKYVKRENVEAIQVKYRNNLEDVIRFLGEYGGNLIRTNMTDSGKISFSITMRAITSPILMGSIGDYIVKDEFNHYEVVPKKEFEQTYSEVE